MKRSNCKGVIELLKLGIIGTNIITDQMLDAAKTTGKYELTAVYSRTKKHAEKFGKPYGATQFFDSLEDFFKNTEGGRYFYATSKGQHTHVDVEFKDNDYILQKRGLYDLPGFHQAHSCRNEHDRHDLNQENARFPHLICAKQLKMQTQQHEKDTVNTCRNRQRDQVME